MPFHHPRFAAPPPPKVAEDQAPVVIVGAGVVGLTLALDLAWRGVASVVLDEDDTVSIGSRAICWAKRTLEIYGRLGLGARFLAKGVTWNRGRVFHGEAEAYAFDLLPEQGHEYPAFVNLQQYYVEAWLVEACAATGLVELRWRHAVTGFENRADGPLLVVTSPGGAYAMRAEWLVGADGARSFLRRALALPFIGQEFRDRFLIADITMTANFPAERRFWFDPPFHPGQSVLLHKQPDDVWRVDFQLGWEADPEVERQPERVLARLRAMLGDVPFTLEWTSVYSFRCRRMERFRHDRTFFVGDAAHQVSPFGARGGNGGVQDADNLGWKLAAVLAGRAPDALLDSYDAERIPAADENILNSTRSTDFITPKNDAARAYRDAVLGLAAGQPFARPLVNSGRLSRPHRYAGTPLSSADDAPWPAGALPGAPAPDAPLVAPDGAVDWLLRRCGAPPHGALGAPPGFTLLAFAGGSKAPTVAPEGMARLVISDLPAPGAWQDQSGLAAARFGAGPGDAVLLRPDQHVAARFRHPTPAGIAAAATRALAHAGGAA